jgi:hypothetical protein
MSPAIQLSQGSFFGQVIIFSMVSDTMMRTQNKIMGMNDLISLMPIKYGTIQ